MQCINGATCEENLMMRRHIAINARNAAKQLMAVGRHVGRGGPSLVRR